MPYLHPDAFIINTTSITAYRGSPKLLDYSATKGAIVAFTRSLSQQLMDRRILLNAVAPGPVRTPLIPGSLDAEAVSKFGADSPMGSTELLRVERQHVPGNAELDVGLELNQTP